MASYVELFGRPLNTPKARPRNGSAAAQVWAVAIVVPTFREAESLPVLAGRIAAELSRDGLEWERVLVDDGSGDGSEQVAADLAQHLPEGVMNAGPSSRIAPAGPMSPHGGC